MASFTLTIDGSQGEGGGQVLRSSLALSLVTGKPFVMEKIRAGRDKPGLQRQHLAAVLAAAEVGQAEVDGAELGSKRLSFRPGEVRPGEYSFRIGSAGSTTLVVQTVLPALLLGESESRLSVDGGTHNPMAPSADFLKKAYFPQVNRLGPHICVGTAHARHGFYPAGGGQLNVHVQPARQLGRLDLIERGPLVAQRVEILLSRLPRHIADREFKTIAALSGWPQTAFTIVEVSESRGPGNAVMIELEFQFVTEIFTAIGRIGVRGPHLADQLLLPLGIGAHFSTGGGQFRTSDLTLHSRTHIEILRRFLDIAVHIEKLGDNNSIVRIEPA